MYPKSQQEQGIAAWKEATHDDEVMVRGDTLKCCRQLVCQTPVVYEDSKYIVYKSYRLAHPLRLDPLEPSLTRVPAAGSRRMASDPEYR